MKSSNGNDPIRMIPLLRFAEAREIDRRTLRRDPRGESFAADSEILLMGLAAMSALHALKADGLLSAHDGTTPDRHDSTDGENVPSIIFLCGNGNNGGDGLALAYLLAGDPERPLGSEPAGSMHIFARLPMRSRASQYYQARLAASGVQIRPLEEFPGDARPIGRRDIIIEAMLGTGQNGAPEGLYDDVLARIKQNRLCRLVSLDVPAGLTEDDPPAFDRSPDTDALPLPGYIYTFGAEKAALRLHADLATSGIRALPCGFDTVVEEEVSRDRKPSFQRVEFPQQTDWLSSNRSHFGRHAADHKYSAGHAWLIGGSPGMEGAALMSLRAFFASGGGYARLFHSDAGSREIYLRLFPPGLYHSMEDLPGQETAPGRPPRVIVIGPGLSAIDMNRFGGRILTALHELAETAGKEASLPLVLLDAAACALAFRSEYPDVLRPLTLLTPHAGEWSQLGGPSPTGVNGTLLALDYLQSRSGVSALLKGPISLLLQSDDVHVYDWVRPELATAGSGDLLAGLIARALATAPASGREGANPRGIIESATHQSMAFLHTLARGRSSAAEFLAALEHWSLPGRTGPALELKER